MPSTLLPFLYQTRTLQRALGIPVASHLARSAHTSHRPRTRTRKPDNAIPFDWDSSATQNGLSDGLSEGPGLSSTITPSEAEVFKGIFDEIAQGKMPLGKRPLNPKAVGTKAGKSRKAAHSIAEQARVNQFREKFLRSFPQSLRNAAQVALGLFEVKSEESETGESQRMEILGGNRHVLKQRMKFDLKRTKELERVEHLMKNCETDAALWSILEDEVFSLPSKLGILQMPPNQDPLGEAKELEGEIATLEESEAGRKLAEDNAASEEPNGETKEQKRLMDIHGPLYSQFISIALEHFEIAFANPSPYAFQILPRVKGLGLPSYVLGVSTPFYSRLAKMHWEVFGDANSALDMLREMNAVGLYADRGVKALLGMMRDHLHGCTAGDQGDFVMGMTQSPPYDGVLMQKLNDTEKAIRLSLHMSASG